MTASRVTGSVAYATQPCRAELVAVLVVGLLHVVTEVALSGTAAMVYNLLAVVGFAAYLVWRALRSKGAMRTWGMRGDNFGSAMAAHGGFGLLAAAGILGYGWLSGSLNLPATFWATIAVYPAWGIAQQFALQSLVARNLSGLVAGAAPLALIAAGLFAMAHYPRLDLVALTFGAGFFLTLVYRRFPNLWAVGIVHGVLGSLAFYVLLGEDPMRMLVEILTRG